MINDNGHEGGSKQWITLEDLTWQYKSIIQVFALKDTRKVPLGCRCSRDPPGCVDVLVSSGGCGRRGRGFGKVRKRCVIRDVGGGR